MYFKCILNLRAGPPGLNSTQNINFHSCLCIPLPTPSKFKSRQTNSNAGYMEKPNNMFLVENPHTDPISLSVTLFGAL